MFAVVVVVDLFVEDVAVRLGSEYQYLSSERFLPGS